MKYTLDVKGCPELSEQTAYVANLYRANFVITREDVAYLKHLPAFSVLLIQTAKSRTLEICPPREVRGQQLSG